MGTDPTTIEHLAIQNIGRHESFAIDARDLAAIEILGKGEAGKTTILDAIAGNLTGKNLPSVRNGAKEGWIETTIAGVKVRRTLNAAGGTKALEVMDERQGVPITKERQGYLDDLFGGWIPRPLEIYHAKPKDRLKYVLRALDIDKAEVVAQLKRILEDDHPLPAGAADPDTDWDPAECFEKIALVTKEIYNLRRDTKKERDTLAQEINVNRDALPNLWNPETAPPEPPPTPKELYETRDGIRKRNTARASLQDRIAELKAQLESAEAQLDNLGADLEDEAGITQQIEQYEALAQKYADDQKRHGEYTFRLAEVEKRQGTCTRLIKQVDRLEDMHAKLVALPAALLSRAKLPIEGLEVREEELYVEGVPLDDRGDSMKLMLCAKIAMALAPERLKVLLLDGCESMDSDQRVELVTYCKSMGFQVVMTRVVDDLAIQWASDPIDDPASEVSAPPTVAAAAVWDDQ